MTIQSIYGCKTVKQVTLLVADQPTPLMFFKVFLELNLKNLLSYLSFDRRSIQNILQRDIPKFVDPQFPLFFKNRDGRSAVDTALDNNLLRSVSLMIDYIIQYQNTPVYHHLFTYNLIDLIQRRVPCTKLFQSNIFNMEISYYEWPQMSCNPEKKFRAYNKSVFKTRFEYANVFPELYHEELEQEESKKQEVESEASYDSTLLRKQKRFGRGTRRNRYLKIKYACNLLCAMSEEDGKLIDALCDTRELTLFETCLVRDLIDFRWDKFALTAHRVGMRIHITQMVVTTFYVRSAYLGYTYGYGEAIKYGIQALVFVLLIYPCVYDAGQLHKQGLRAYFASFWNYVDVLHIYGGFINMYL